MKKLPFKISLLFVAPLIFIASVASAQTLADAGAVKPAVVKAVAPKTYPAIAKTARAGGKVVVKVIISSTGKVTSAKTMSGHPLLANISEVTAMRWLFAATEKKDEGRFVELEFVYEVADRDEEAGTFFMPPYQVALVESPPPIIH